jgi:hypothetical protein
MTEEEIKELQELRVELKNYRIFFSNNVQYQRAKKNERLTFLEGKKEEYDYQSNLFEHGKREGRKEAYREMNMAEFYSSSYSDEDAYDSNALKNKSDDFKEGYEAHKLSQYGQANKYRKALERDLESGNSNELSRILIQAFKHENCSKAARINTFVNLIKKFPESAIIAIKNIVGNHTSNECSHKEAMKQLNTFLHEYQPSSFAIPYWENLCKEEGFKEAEDHFKQLLLEKDKEIKKVELNLQSRIKDLERINKVFFEDYKKLDIIRDILDE